jgi:mannosyltransferase
VPQQADLSLRPRTVKRPGPESRLAQRTVWVLPTLATLLLGLFQSPHPELWRDELASVDASSRSIGQLFDLLGNVDASTGFYYVVLHFWTAVFGDSPAVLRLPSVLAMAGAAACVALTGRRLFGRWAGICGGLLFALVPSISRYGQEARAYAFAVCAVALATLLLLRALDGATARVPDERAPKIPEQGPTDVRRKTSWGRWVGYGAALLLIGLCHIVALACLAGHLVLLLLHWLRTRDNRALRLWAGNVVAALALLSPLVVLGQSQVGNQLNWLQAPSLAHPGTTLKWMLASLFASTGVTVLFLVLSLFALLLRRRHRDQLLFVVASVVLPILAILVISRLGTSYWLGRYLMFTLPAWSVLAGAGTIAVARLLADRLAPGSRRVRRRIFAGATALSVAVAVLVGYSDQAAIRSYTSHSDTLYPRIWPGSDWDYQGVARVLKQHARSGDGVYYGGSPIYFAGAGVEFYLDGAVRLDQFLVTRPAAETGSYSPGYCTDVSACVAKAPDRVWLVTAPDRPGPEDSKALRALLGSGTFKVTARYPMDNVVLTLVERKG